MEIENTDRVERGIWKGKEDGYFTLYQDDKAVANLVYMKGKYFFFYAMLKSKNLKKYLKNNKKIIESISFFRFSLELFIILK
ncbi:MAG: hypothetical protein V8Q12_09915 [Agathobacter rectalis]